jgi:YHS domain-containing protein
MLCSLRSPWNTSAAADGGVRHSRDTSVHTVSASDDAAPRGVAPVLTARRPRSGWPRWPACVVAACLTIVIGQAMAAQWHPDLAAGQAASAVTGRPVLAVVSVRWAGTEAAALEKVLASPEADAVITACFEPVRIDADTNLEFVRRAGIAHVPTGCIVAADGTVLTVFEMPTSSVEFVAAVARLAQQYPHASTQEPTAAEAPRELVDRTTPPRTAPATGGVVSVADVPSPFAGTGLVEDVPSPRGSISMVTSKLRRLSSFAADDLSPRASAPTASITDHPLPVRQSGVADTLHHGLASTASGEEPQLSVAPPGWPAERSGPLSPTSEALPPRPAIEPAGTSRFTNTAPPAPWLDAPPAAQSVDPWGRPVATAPMLPPTPATPPLTAAPALAAATPWTPPTAQATGMPQSAPAAVPQSAPAADAAAPSGTVTSLPDRASPAEPPAKSSSLLATLQKPFTALWRQTPATTEPPTLPPARPQRTIDAPATAAAAAPADPADPADAAGSMPLGLEGYCPVTLVDQGAWAEGRVQYGARHRGRTYLFAGSEQQQTFLANPDRYAPALSGDDPVLAMESRVSTPGQRRYGVTYQSRMYLFTSPETRAAFSADPSRYSAAVLVAERGPQVADGTRRY